MSKSFLMARVLSEGHRGRHIAFRWHVLIMDAGSTETVRLEPSYLNCLDAAVRRYVRHKWDNGLSLVSLTGSLDWIMQSISEPGPPLLSLRALVTVRGFPQNPSSSADPDLRSILVLPSRIDIVGSTAIIRHTLAVTYYGWSLFSAGGWRKPLPKTMRSRTARLILPHNWAIHGPFSTETGNQDTTLTND